MYTTAYANNPDNWPKDNRGNAIPPDMGTWNTIQQGAVNSAGGSEFQKIEATYADQIPPFDIVITFQNEYGQSASMSILGVEILNEGSGMSIDDITTEKACTFVARELVHLH